MEQNHDDRGGLHVGTGKSAVTPVMAQFLEIKAQHPDALLFFRMGDFYEMFFDDAAEAAAALDIALTKRGKHEGNDIPMCGVPAHSAEGYLLTLIRKGFRVAVCEQMESPAEAKKRGSKAVVRREVVRLVTPGTLTEDSLLEARRHNFLAAFSLVREEAALAWVDISTGALWVTELAPSKLAPELARLAPSEVLVSETIERDWAELVTESGASCTPLSRASFDSTSGERRLTQVFGVDSLEAFGAFGRAEVSALGGLIDYIDITQRGQLPLLRPPQRERSGSAVQIDAATRRNLEITTGMNGGRQGSLLAAIDRTATAGGARLLERRLSAPSRDIDTINGRHDAIAAILDAPALADRITQAMRSVPDLDRALSRLALDRGGPRDMAAIRQGLTQAQALAGQIGDAGLPQLLAQSVERLSGHDGLIDLLDDALIAEPPLLARDGGFVAAGYDEELDQTRALRDEGRGVIAGMQRDYAEQTGVQSLKIKHNNVLGYFIETTATHADKMLSEPLNETFIHRQTTANQVRFTTVELSELETRILNAGNHALEIEKRHYSSLKDAILDQSAQIHEASRALAEIDLACAMADLARSEDWTRPKVDQSRSFVIEGGRHPVVEAALRRAGEPFVANDCQLGDGATWLLTGPNMAGKSTFLRQNALIGLLAQAGAYVPARAAHIGVISQLFSRVGASDDLARGRSTFMVEMVETAAILNQADDRALVILDEIGRGTATWDGLSIAWATLEHLHEVNRCRALFATHYHELTQLAQTLDGVSNATVAVKEWEGEVIFLHEVRQGAADRSYGVQVAQLAGLPPAVVERARSILAALEEGDRKGAADPKAIIDDLPLFSTLQDPVPQRAEPATPELEAALRQMSPDEMTPREALQALYDLRDLLPG